MQNNTDYSQNIYYFTHFDLFDHYHAQSLCNYKHFIENLIIKLGQDWRIEASLFTQQILALLPPDPTRISTDFNLFNEFLSAYLKDKIGREFECTSLSQSHLEEDFLQKLNHLFNNDKIQTSLTFKTLSLGYCITAHQIWNRTFKHHIKKHNTIVTALHPFAKITHITPKNNTKINQAQSKWTEFKQQQFSQLQIASLLSHLPQSSHTLNETQILSHFVCVVDQINLNNKTIRVFSLHNEFYIHGFIIWLIFSIKTFFCLPPTDYLRYCKQLLGTHWKQQFENTLKILQTVLEQEWNRLMKDYRVVLHDDLEVLKTLISYVKKQIQLDWQNKLTILKQTFPPTP